MDSVTLQEINRLVRPEAKPLATVYMTTHPTGQDGMQDELRLRHLLDQVEEWLKADGMRGPVARDAVQRARELVSHKNFWEFRSQGLALFLSENSCRAIRLPQRFEELVFVGDRFHVKPLLSHTSDTQRFLVLAFSQKRPRLLAGSLTELREIDVPNMPAAIEMVLETEDVEHGTQMHSVAISGGGNRRAGVFHGHGGERDTAKSQLETYCRDVNAALQPLLHDETAPLVVVAVGSVHALLRNELTYAHALPQCVEGNPDHLSLHEMHELTWSAVQPSLDAPRRNALARLKDTLNTARSTTQISEVLRAAVGGQVDTVLVNRERHCWGKFDEPQLQVHIHEQPTRHDEDLLDTAIHLTLRHGGHAYLAAPDELPDQAEIAALYRFV